MDTRLYDKVINAGITLTTKELNSLGYNAKSINKLIDVKMISRVKRGHYKFINANVLFDYGYKSLRNDKELFKRCLLRCLEITPNYKTVAYNLFYLEVYASNYEKAVEYLGILINKTNLDFQKDYNCYLFLLSFLIDLPEEYQQKVDKMKVQDLLLDSNDKRYKNKKRTNDIRTAIFNGKWSYASRNLYKMKTGLGVDFVINRLLKDVQNKMTNTLKYLWEKGQYQDFISFLKFKRNHCSLERMEFFYLHLAKTYVNIMETKILPYQKEIKIGTFYDYISANDFTKALKVYKGQNEMLRILLEDICSLIKTIKSSDVKSVESDLVTALFKFSLDGNISLVKYVLRIYLQGIHKEKYMWFILNHIRLCLLENDFSFIKPMSILAQLKNDTFGENLKYYEELLQDYEKENNVDGVKLVTDLIDFLNGGLEKKVEHKESNSEKIDPYLQTKYNELISDKGLILLTSMELQERKRIIEQLNGLPNVSWFTIGDNEPKRLVLQYVLKSRRYIDAKNIIRNLQSKYDKRKYQEVIADCLQVLRLKKVKAYTCYRMGLSYWHIGEYQKAIDYLIIAEELSKGENRVKYDFTELIAKIRNMAYFKDEEFKEFTVVELQEFEKHDVDSDFITIKEIVLIDGHDVKSVCQQLGYDNNQIGKVLILLAKECYMVKNVEEGDNYIKEFERMLEKSRENIELAEEVKRNKKLYTNRGIKLERIRR